MGLLTETENRSAVLHFVFVFSLIISCTHTAHTILYVCQSWSFILEMNGKIHKGPLRIALTNDPSKIYVFTLCRKVSTLFVLVDRRVNEVLSGKAIVNFYRTKQDQFTINLI